MTREEAIARIIDHKIVHKMNEPRAVFISEALDMAIQALSQEPTFDDECQKDMDEAWEQIQKKRKRIPVTLDLTPCTDAVSREAVLKEFEKGTENLYGRIDKLPSVTQKSIECDDAISREDVLVEITRFSTEEGASVECQQLYCDVNNMPSVTQKSGKWIYDETLEKNELSSVQRKSNADEKHVENTLEDAISRQAVLDYLKANVDDFPDYHEAIEKVLQIPSVTQKSGKWITEEISEGRKVYCSECKESAVFEYVRDGDIYSSYGHGVVKKTKYCPNCGCRMVEPQERSKE